MAKKTGTKAASMSDDQAVAQRKKDMIIHLSDSKNRVPHYDTVTGRDNWAVKDAQLKIVKGEIATKADLEKDAATLGLLTEQSIKDAQLAFKWLKGKVDSLD